jgi:hypothetical protein
MTDTSDTANRLAGHVADSGILPLVPGEFIGQACQQLPSAEIALSDTMTADIAAGWVGTVRITFERMRYKCRKFVSHYWVATRADRVGQ